MSKLTHPISIPTGGVSFVRRSFGQRGNGDMNHQHDEEHANGHQVNGEQPTEEELDAYEERLTNEAIIDQVKVTI